MSFHSVSELPALNISENLENKVTCAEWLGRKIKYFANGLWEGLQQLFNYICEIFKIAFLETGMTTQIFIHGIENEVPKRELRTPKGETLTDETMENDSYYEGD